MPKIERPPIERFQEQITYASEINTGRSIHSLEFSAWDMERMCDYALELERRTRALCEFPEVKDGNS